MKKTKLKHQLRCTDEEWDRVLLYKIKRRLKVNDAVLELIARGLREK